MIKMYPEYRCKLVKVGEHSAADHDQGAVYQAVALAERELRDEPVESILAIYVSGKASLQGVELLARGGKAGACVTMADVFRGAIVAGASAVILAHNHPSGDPSPSYEDLEMLSRVKRAGEMLGVPLLDFIVVGRDSESWSAASIEGVL